VIGGRQGEVTAPDFIQPVVGYRSWRLRGGALLSPYVDGVAWDGQPLQARCMPYPSGLRPRGPHEVGAPGPRCECGIYAYFEPIRRLGGNPQLVFGAVVLWGRIEVHRDGMRAEWALPVALARDARHDPVEVERAAAAIGIAAVDERELEATALQHGRALPRMVT
jgi:hypothetical protein